MATEHERPTVEGFPFGRCECDYASCTQCGGRGPAAWSVKRAGRAMRVCTRCWFSTDDERVPLLTRKTPSAPFLDWDALGAMHLAFALAPPDVGQAPSDADRP